MQKKNWYLISLIFYVGILNALAFSAYAQVNFRINSAADLVAGSQVVDNQTTNYNSTLSVAPSVNLSTSSQFFKIGTAATLLNSNLFTARVIGSGGAALNLLTLGVATPTINLSTNPTPVYTTLLGLLANGLINLRYAIPQPSLFAWRAGTYTNTLSFTLGGISVATLTPSTAPINCIVASFISAPSTQNLSFTINSLDYYASTALPNQSNTLTVTATVNHGIKLKTNTSVFTYSNGYAGATDPLIPGSVLSAQLTLPVATTAVNPTISYKVLTAATGYDVPTGNTTTSTITYSLSNAVLKANFLKKGIYTITLNNELFDVSSPPSSSSQFLTPTLTVNVNDLAKLKVNNNDVNLIFATTANYKNGVHTDMPAHITLSGTSPYDVSVQASTPTLTNGSNTLPVGIIQIAPTPDNPSDFNTITLSNQPQKILSALPVLDRKLNVRYIISAAKAAQVLGKASGSYTTVVTYSLVAP